MNRRPLLVCVLALLAALLAVFMGLAAYWAHLGYFGGPVFVPVPASGAPDPSRRGLVAVIVSGDMGFKVGMGPKLAERFSREGIPVVGVNSLAYFRHKRTAPEAGSLIEQAMGKALALSPTAAASASQRRVVVIGQSFGGDMVNVGSRFLSPEWRQRVLAIELVVPTDTIDFRASPAELLDLEAPDESAIPPGRKLGWVPTLCVYGREETESLCPHLLGQTNVNVVSLPGGHKLNQDVNAVFSILMMNLEAAWANEYRPRAPSTDLQKETAR